MLMVKRLVVGLKALKPINLGARIDAFLREGFALAGASLIVYGVSLMHRPSAFLIAGAMCLAVAWGRAK